MPSFVLTVGVPVADSCQEQYSEVRGGFLESALMLSKFHVIYLFIYLNETLGLERGFWRVAQSLHLSGIAYLGEFLEGNLHTQPQGSYDSKMPRRTSFQVVTRGGHEAAALLHAPF